jgi:hypothetical protein
MSNIPVPLSLTIYGINEQGEELIKKQLSRSHIPWGILERALDIQEAFETVETAPGGEPKMDREQVNILTDFVVFMFDDAVQPEQLKRGASLLDMFNLYQQIFRMVAQVMPKNPTTALTPAQNLQKVKQGRKK